MNQKSNLDMLAIECEGVNSATTSAPEPVRRKKKRSEAERLSVMDLGPAAGGMARDVMAQVGSQRRRRIQRRSCLRELSEEPLLRRARMVAQVGVEEPPRVRMLNPKFNFMNNAMDSEVIFGPIESQEVHPWELSNEDQELESEVEDASPMDQVLEEPHVFEDQADQAESEKEDTAIEILEVPVAQIFEPAQNDELDIVEVLIAQNEDSGNEQVLDVQKEQDPSAQAEEADSDKDGTEIPEVSTDEAPDEIPQGQNDVSNVVEAPMVLAEEESVAQNHGAPDAHLEQVMAVPMVEEAPLAQQQGGQGTQNDEAPDLQNPGAPDAQQQEAQVAGNEQDPIVPPGVQNLEAPDDQDEEARIRQNVQVPEAPIPQNAENVPSVEKNPKAISPIPLRNLPFKREIEEIVLDGSDEEPDMPSPTLQGFVAPSQQIQEQAFPIHYPLQFFPFPMMNSFNGPNLYFNPYFNHHPNNNQR